MNESDFESELRKLRPAAPSRKLAEGIAQELASISSVVDLRTDTRSMAHAREEVARTPWFMLWLDRLLWSGLGATAVLALMLSQQTPTPAVAQSSHQQAQTPSRASSPQDSSLLQPVLASEEDLGWRDEGVGFDAQGQPMLKLTRTAVKREAWADLKNAGVVQMETPRQEVMWVPVAVH